jgi:hypothetical protein
MFPGTSHVFVPHPMMPGLHVGPPIGGAHLDGVSPAAGSNTGASAPASCGGCEASSSDASFPGPVLELLDSDPLDAENECECEWEWENDPELPSKLEEPKPDDSELNDDWKDDSKDDEKPELSDEEVSEEEPDGVDDDRLLDVV